LDLTALDSFGYRILQSQNQLQYDDTSLNFIRNVTQTIESKYPATNTTLQIDSSSCRLAGNLFCSHLVKMLFTFYNVEPIISDRKSIKSETVSGKNKIL